MALSKEHKSTVADIVANIKKGKESLDNAIKEFKSVLDSEGSELEDLKGELEDDFDNLSETMQEGEKGQSFQEKISKIDDICSSMDDIGDKLDVDVTEELLAELDDLAK